MTAFTRRGLLGTFLAAPFMKVFKIKVPAAHVEASVATSSEDVFHIALLDEFSREITPLLKITEKEGVVVFDQDAEATEPAMAYRLYLPESWVDRLPLSCEYVETSLDTVASLRAGDIRLEFPRGKGLVTIYGE